ncbi:hypothetical protein [Pseudoduganella umbonata]|uniref:Methyl-accepting chemotaxis protein n=1 Tax=Pseudoduganella umbonata TaxID=864828 RepID=A0A4V1ED33_9BURK|nr:hypothetical protein [Pseudoduganella umbonata]MBB3219617.1 methyl-accepting chemotaxis protein [Pseudoduganella umbonata]QCP09681.1 hypothetical protein FCL38_04030 [Pseudoduganella umbonata]
MHAPVEPAPGAGAGPDLPALVAQLHAIDAQIARLEAGAQDEAAAQLASVLDSIDEIEQMLDDLQQARTQWQEALAETAGQIETLVEELQQEFAAAQDSAAAQADNAEAASQALEDAVQERLAQLVDDAAGLSKAAEQSFGEAMRGVSAGTEELGDAAAAQRLEQVRAAGSEVFEKLNGTLDGIESAGVGAAADVIDVLDDITRQIDDIVQVITGIRPALDAVAAIA